jgi:hypothetical protein
MDIGIRNSWNLDSLGAGYTANFAFMDTTARHIGISTEIGNP